MQRRIVKWCVLALLLLFVLVALVVTIAELTVQSAKNGRSFYSAEQIPGSNHVGLVLGCSPFAFGGANPYYTTRIDAAVQLWQSGKVYAIIVSGDNRTRDYDEAGAMKNDLVKRGVPSERIVCDYAGLRTLDSIVRAKEIFDAQSIVIVSQEFHNGRALVIARHFGIDAYALNAEAVTRGKKKNWLRERSARVLMLLDLWILNTSPRHMGQKEALPQPFEAVSE